MKNYTKIMEVFWLIVALATTFLAIKKIVTFGINNETLLFLFPPIIAYAMWFIRRRFRKKEDQK